MIFEVNKREIRCIDESFQHFIGDNADYKAVFIFDEEWNGHIKTARFIQNEQYVEKILEDDKCDIPVEVLKQGTLKVGVYTPEMVTTPCEVYIRQSIKEFDGATAEPTPDVYSQIIKMIEQIEVSGVTDEQIERAVTKYLSEHPIETLTESDVQRIVNEYVTAHKNELKGEPGEPGYTPIKGTDYWTTEDIADILSYIDNKIGGALNGSY